MLTVRMRPSGHLMKGPESMRDGAATQALTNVNVFKRIADEAYEEMTRAMNAGRRPKEDGTGFLLTYDPHQKSFKQSLISIVFSTMWLEALLHLMIVQMYGIEVFKEYDHKSYEEKLGKLGYFNEDIIQSISTLRKVRRTLLHEKAHIEDNDVKTAQGVAENAAKIRTALHEYFRQA